ncbi:MAG: monovalent cation:proton antiporter family protein [Chloroflexota bacterium]
MQHDTPFTPLLLITLLAVAVPLLVSRIKVIRLPGVVGEIIAGMVIGQSGLDLVEHSPTLDFLAEFGFVFLMFLSGLEVNFGLLFGAVGRANGAAAGNGSGITTRKGATLRALLHRPVPLALLVFTCTVCLALLVGSALVVTGLARNAVLMGLILSTTSLGIVVPVLRERGLSATRYGQVLLATALVSDFVTLLLLSLTIAVISQGLSLELLLFMLLLAAFMAAAKIGQWAIRNRALTRAMEELAHATSQVKVRGAFALMIAWVVLSQSLGVEVILGAFLAGAVISLSSQRHESPLREKLDAIGFGFFIPIFFIMVGADFDLRSLAESPAALTLVPVLIAAAYAVKMLPSLLFRVRFSWRETLGAGMLLSSRLSLIIAASAIALDLELISKATNAAVVLVAVITCTLSPVLFARFVPTPERKRRSGVIILGTDAMARLLATRLHRHNTEEITFVSRDGELLAQLKAAGFRIVEGNPADESVLARAGGGTARALVAVPTASDILLDVCQLATQRFNIPEVVARTDDPDSVRTLQQLGARVIQPAMATALAIEGALQFPASFDMLMDQEDDVEVVDAQLGNAQLAGLPLRRVRLPGSVLVMAVRREGETMVPNGDTVVRSGDTLMLVGSPAALRDARALVMGTE